MKKLLKKHPIILISTLWIIVFLFPKVFNLYGFERWILFCMGIFGSLIILIISKNK